MDATFSGTPQSLSENPVSDKNPKDKYSSGCGQEVQSRTRGTSCHQTYSVHDASVQQSVPASTNGLCCPSPCPPLPNPAPHLSAASCLHSLQHCNKPNQGVGLRQQLNLPTKSKHSISQASWLRTCKGIERA